MEGQGRFRRLWNVIVKYRAIYFLLLPGLIWYLMFAIAPLSGLQLAFKTYKANLGIFGSPFTGWANFRRVFHDVNFWNAIRQTLLINVVRLIVTFPFPILMAILFNEMRFHKVKNPLQVVFTLPHFLSWVIIASIFNNLLSFDGFVNNIIASLGLERVKIVGSTSAFMPLLYYTDIWRTAGWNTIVYLAAITDIEMEQYEAAEIDGATRFQMITHVTIPSIRGTIIIMFILATGNIMTAGFNQVFNMSNAAVRSVAETLDMYIYRITFQAAPDFGFSMAITLFRSVINMLLLLVADRGSKMMGGNGLFSMNQSA
ncbi:MAG: sugar ABC transporter permease [Clostridia bacterium]|nr:sugar ABC transporter permease [Clostridia bacterium]